MSPLSMLNFSLIRAHIRVLWRMLLSVRNEDEDEEKKNEGIKMNFCLLVSRKWLERFPSNVVSRLP